MAHIDRGLLGLGEGFRSLSLATDDAASSENVTSPELNSSPVMTTPNSTLTDATANTKTSRYVNQDGRRQNITEDYCESSKSGEVAMPRLGYSNARYSRGAFRNSRTWMSEDAKHQQEWMTIRNAMRRLFKNSEVAKWKYADWVAHKEAMLKSEQSLLARKMIAKEEAKLRINITDEDVEKARAVGASMRDRLFFEGNRSLVLGEKTIWCLNWRDGKPEDEIAPWPSYAELKWEGDDRAKTAVGRFLPLPREPGAPNILWNQLQVVEQYPLDEVARIPTMEDIYLPVDEIDDAVKYDLINKDLEEDIDAFLES